MPARTLALHGPYTVVYSDVDASTPLNERLGDVAARELMRAHRTLVRAQLEHHGGVELTQLGDGFKLAFPDATRSVAFAVALQRALASERERHGATGQLSVRIGIHCGDAAVEEGDLFGHAVIVAQRVVSRAQPGQILISQSAASEARLEPGVSTLDRGVFLLKGLQDGLRLYEVLWRTGDERASLPERERAAPAAGEPRARDALPRPPLVGRRAELESLESALQTVEKGAGRVLLISGEPGIGKTRLCVEFLELIARRDVRRAVGRAFAEGRAPYRPLRECLAQLRAGGGLRVPRSLAARASAADARRSGGGPAAARARSRGRQGALARSAGESAGGVEPGETPGAAARRSALGRRGNSRGAPRARAAHRAGPRGAGGAHPAFRGRAHAGGGGPGAAAARARTPATA